MAKRKWSDEKLKKRSQTCMFVAVLFAVMLVIFYFANLSPYLMIIPMVGAIIFYVLSWLAEGKDKKMSRAKLERELRKVKKPS